MNPAAALVITDTTLGRGVKMPNISLFQVISQNYMGLIDILDPLISMLSQNEFQYNKPLTILSIAH